MKIAMVVEHCHKQGGQERVVAELAERIADCHEVHIFVNSFDDLKNKRIITHHVPMFKKPALLTIISFILSSTCQLRRQKFDIIHSQGPNAIVQNVITDHTTQRAKMEALPRFIKNKKRTFIQRLHDAIFRALVCKIEEIIYSPKSDRRVIAVSKGIQREVFEYYGKSLDEIAVIPNGVDLKKFHPKNRVLYRAEVRRRLNIYNTDFVILFVGGDWERKGLEYIIRSLPFLSSRKARLLVVGGWQREHYVDVARDLGISDLVIFAGKSSAVQELYSVANVLVLPSLYEPFGLVVLEAMASGIPVIVSKCAGAAEVIRDNVNGLLLEDPSNPKMIAAKVSRVLNDLTFMKKIAKNARKTAEQYSWDRMAAEVMKVYEEVVRARKN